MDDLSEIFDHLFGDSDGLIDGLNSDSIESIDELDSMINSIGVNDSISSLGNVDFNDAMNEALSSFNHELQIPNSDSINFTGHEHHDPFSGEHYYDSNNDISFEGNGDKYTDNNYNQQQADKWLAKEQDCLVKGDKTGAAAAHATAMDHLKRIKN